MRKKETGFRVLKPHMEGLIKFFVIAAIAIITRVIVNFATPQVIKFTVDSVLSNGPIDLPLIFINLINAIGGVEVIRDNLWIPACSVVFFAIIICICDYISKVNIAKGSEGLVRNLRNHTYKHVQKLPYKWHTNNQTGDTIQRVTADVDLLRRFVSVQLSELFRIVMLLIISLALMFSMNVKLSLIALAFIPIIMIYTTIFYGLISKKFKDADEADGEMYSVAQENLTGVRVVRAFGRVKYELDKFADKNKTYANMWLKLGHQLSCYWAVGDVFSGLQILTIIVFGALETMSGAITLGEFLAFVSYNSMLVWPIRAFGRVLSELGKAKVSLERISEILNEEEEKDDENALSPDFISKDIVFDNVTFRYENNQPVVENLSFTINGGETFAILGGTGSGKTTIMHLLNRLYELEDGCGAIKIGGTNIKDIKLSHLRKNIGMVLQEPFLYSKTIKENVAITKETLDMEEIKRATSTACVDESIENFLKGYDTIVGERGVTLSGGQKQRVAISRMLMQNTPVMVFDDSLSAVDSETDLKIRSALKNNRTSATTIIISHRITTLMQANKIMVLDKGKIVDIGTHKELIERDGIYKDIFNVQMNLTDIKALEVK